MKKKKNQYLMWVDGPMIELPDECYWDIAAQEVVMNDLTWHGDLSAFWLRRHERSRQSVSAEAHKK
jgi:hypothetical protein